MFFLLALELSMACPEGTRLMFNQTYNFDNTCVEEKNKRHNNALRNLMLDNLDYTRCRREKIYNPYCQEVKP